MQYLGEAYTAGGPVAIIQHPYLGLWDGNEDYFETTRQPRNGSLQVLSSYKETYPLCLFYHESDGNFQIYYDRSTLHILSEITAEEGHEIRLQFPAIDNAIVDKPSIQLSSFGGKVHVFDAALPGRTVTRQEVGCEHVSYRIASLSKRNNAALVEIDCGHWEALELYYKSTHLEFNGVLFRMVERSERW
jgi:hypothetical protein